MALRVRVVVFFAAVALAVAALRTGFFFSVVDFAAGLRVVFAAAGSFVLVVLVVFASGA